MKCRKCGAENLDGAESCNTCRAPLVATTGRPGAGRSQAGLWIGIATAAVFAIVLVAIFANGGSGGGGSVGGPIASPSARSAAVARSEKAAVKSAEAFVKKSHPELLHARRDVTSEDVNGRIVTTVSYSGTQEVQLPGGDTGTIPNVVVIERDARTGRTVYSVSN